jgi:hypothetical protein
MGLRDRLSRGIQKVRDRLSGEYSAAAPDEIIPMDRPGVANENAKVIRAKLKRPTDLADKETGGGDD